MEYAHLLEATMLVCFGFSWPLNVIKAYKARTAKGTSLAFIILIITGYVAGISAKVLNGQFNYVLVVYFINLAIVLANVFVYIRNKALDAKAAIKREEPMTNYTYSFDELLTSRTSTKELQGEVILFGTGVDTVVPVEALAKEFDFNFALYNKSDKSVSVANACNVFKNTIAPLKPEGIIIHLGQNDKTAFKSDAAAFDANYSQLLKTVRLVNKKCRIALVSVENPSGDSTVNAMNEHIRALAESEHVDFVSIENAQLWNPNATKAAVKFAYDMGLNIRKPLRSVAEIVYSWLSHNASQAETVSKVV